MGANFCGNASGPSRRGIGVLKGISTAVCKLSNALGAMHQAYEICATAICAYACKCSACDQS